MPLSQSLQKLRKEIGFSRNFLMLLAMFAMLIDHTALTLIINGKLYGYDASLYNNAIELESAKVWIYLSAIMRSFGRISYPLFALLLVEGFRKTSNLFKYFLRVLLLAFISEIPYDLMVFNEFMTARCFTIQNVVFTFVIAILMLSLIRLISSWPVFFTLIPVVIAGFAVYFLKSDYGVPGIILIYVLYIMRNDLNLKCLFALVITFLMSFENYHGAGALSVFFIYFYDGKKGILDLKRINYIFYPLHMIILYGIIFFTYWRK
ncbi:MAG: hypothetical protein IJ593_11240 [Lachnospiraceae bacterium]|nr:hypothetical protein [Lachnospiraceae bacterium]